MMTDSSRPVTGGVDTHKDTHVAAVINHLGAVVATNSFPNRASGHRDLAVWLNGFGVLDRVGIEGTGSYGAGLARHLRDAGIAVAEVNRPDRSARRTEGKSDPLDAVAAARAVLSGRDAGVPKSGDGIVESIRLLRIARRSAIGSRTQCINQIHTVVDTAPADHHDRWAVLRANELITLGVELDVAAGRVEDPAVSTEWTLRCLAERATFLDTQITEIDGRLNVLVTAAAPSLVALFGVGTDTAGALIVAAGDNPQRLRSEASFAALCGVNPLPASSGRTTRHRLNRGGDRTANQALWRIALVRMAHDPETRAYVDKRTEQGLSKREIIRCLKRYIARQVFRHLQTINQPTAP
jgi:transposase